MIQIPFKPVKPVKPCPHRTARRGAMTIAIGIRSNNGIVLAADTQETRSGYTKTYRGKIITSIYDTGFVFAYAGAGATDYVRTAMEKAAKGLGELHSYGEIVQKLEENLLHFFDDHIARWAYFPESERPNVELLIGVSCPKGGFGIFHYEGTSFHRVDQKAIGSGVILADSLLTDSGFCDASVEALASYAASVVSQVKNNVDGCGGSTHIVALRDRGDFGGTDKVDIDAAESLIEAIDRKSARALRASIMAVPLKISWFSDARKRIKKSPPKLSGSQKSEDQQ
jgi:20S proteasome alpha/beta subunit